jgi:hypothetical protein
MAKVPIKKKTTTDLKGMSWDEKMKLLEKYKEENNIVKVEKKPQRWLMLPKAFEDATDVCGIPLNTVSCVKGHTNTGKSTFVLEIIKACQHQQIMPVVFDLENAIKWDHAKDIGVEVDETVNEETGEISYHPGKKIIYYDTTTLYEKYACYDHSKSQFAQKPTRTTYVIEDVALSIRTTIEKQRNGELPFNLMFIIDSIGCSDCYKSATSNASNNMWTAGAISVSFQTIVNDLIPSTQNVTSEYDNSFFYVNKVWNAMSPSGLPVAKEKGGSSLIYSTRFSIFLGNQGSSGLKKMSFTFKGTSYTYGNVVNIKIDKNHITAIEHSGEIASTRTGLCSVKDLEEYKKEHRQYLMKEIKAKTGEEVSEKDLVEVETITDE